MAWSDCQRASTRSPRLRLHNLLTCIRAFYMAGSCLPLFAPSGWREHEEPVKLEMLDAPLPQYLHSYRGLSSPSYKACLPLFAPSGWREQEEPVRLAMLEALVPQYLQ